MERAPKGLYTPEFRAEALLKLRTRITSHGIEAKPDGV